jgi:hypothetical protein
MQLYTPLSQYYTLYPSMAGTLIVHASFWWQTDNLWRHLLRMISLLMEHVDGLRFTVKLNGSVYCWLLFKSWQFDTSLEMPDNPSKYLSKYES